MRWASGDGVSPSVAVQGASAQAAVGRGGAWCVSGGARADLSTEGLRAFPAGFIESRCGAIRRNRVRRGRTRQVPVSQRTVRQPLRQQHGGLWLSLLLSLEGRLGTFSLGLLRQGRVGLGSVVLTSLWQGPDDGTEPFGVPCHPHWMDLVRSGLEWLGDAGCGKQRRGAVRCGWLRSAAGPQH